MCRDLGVLGRECSRTCLKCAGDSSLKPTWFPFPSHPFWSFVCESLKMILLLFLCLVGLATALSVTDVPSCAVSRHALSGVSANTSKIPCLTQMFDSPNGTKPDMRSMCEDHSSLPTEMMSCVTSRCNVEDLRGSIRCSNVTWLILRSPDGVWCRVLQYASTG